MNSLRLLLFCTFFSTTLFSQESLRVGMYTAIKSSTNIATIPNGWKTGVVFEAMPDMGLSLHIPIQTALGLSALADLGVGANSFLVRPYTNQNDSSIRIQRSIYFYLDPSISLPYGYLGMRIGLPVSARMINDAGTTNMETSSVSGTELNLLHQSSVLIELRAAGMMPLIEDANGLLSAYAVVSLQLNSSFTSFSSVSPLIYGSTKTADANDPRVVALSLGLRYVFDWSTAH